MKKFPVIGVLLMIEVLFRALAPIYGASRESPMSMEALRESRVFDLEEIGKVLETHFQSMVSNRNRRIEIKEVRCYEKIILPSGHLSCDVILSEQAHRGGNISAALLFLVNGREVKKVRVSARVDIYADVIAARHYLAKHHEIQEKDVQLVNRNISLLAPDFLTSAEDVLGKRTALTINYGEVIRAGMVEIPPVVKKGDRVVLLVENEHFKITTPGEAKEEGRKGDRIRLVNLSSKKEVHGRVLDGNTVQIDF